MIKYSDLPLKPLSSPPVKNKRDLLLTGPRFLIDEHLVRRLLKQTGGASGRTCCYGGNLDACGS
jgi:hypothetical protein